MMLLIILGLAVLGALGLPYVPLLVAGAFAMCAAAILNSRDRRILPLAGLVTAFAAGNVAAPHFTPWISADGLSPLIASLYSD